MNTLPLPPSSATGSCIPPLPGLTPDPAEAAELPDFSKLLGRESKSNAPRRSASAGDEDTATCQTMPMDTPQGTVTPPLLPQQDTLVLEASQEPETRGARQVSSPLEQPLASTAALATPHPASPHGQHPFPDVGTSRESAEPSTPRSDDVLPPSTIPWMSSGADKPSKPHAAPSVAEPRIHAESDQGTPAEPSRQSVPQAPKVASSPGAATKMATATGDCETKARAAGFALPEGAPATAQTSTSNEVAPRQSLPKALPPNGPAHDTQAAAQVLSAGKYDSAISAETLAPRQKTKETERPLSSQIPDEHKVRELRISRGTSRAEESGVMKPPRTAPAPDPVPSTGSVSEAAVVASFREHTPSRETVRRGRVPTPEPDSPPVTPGSSFEALHRSSIAPAPSSDRFVQPQSGEAAPAITPALRLLHAAIEQITAHPRETAHLDLDLPMEDGQSVRVRLEVREGEIRTTFRTETPEFRHALESGWSNLSLRWQDAGLSLGSATFQGAAPAHPQQQQSSSDDAARRFPPNAPAEGSASTQVSKSRAGREPDSRPPISHLVNSISLWA